MPVVSQEGSAIRRSSCRHGRAEATWIRNDLNPTTKLLHRLITLNTRDWHRPDDAACHWHSGACHRRKLQKVGAIRPVPCVWPNLLLQYNISQDGSDQNLVSLPSNMAVFWKCFEVFCKEEEVWYCRAVIAVNQAHYQLLVCRSNKTQKQKQWRENNRCRSKWSSVFYF